jgi:hypothetical protein
LIEDAGGCYGLRRSQMWDAYVVVELGYGSISLSLDMDSEKGRGSGVNEK